ncbi:PrgI family protein [Actinomadura rupiterrae]|uniref:PrgI family protein n=1 Tax=Actinomadura rupiterrae TaxID=559627 RepID=UPI0020A32957|nr:PrgI family protein [Actinomadura rupiterrae]MCP2341173.1 hypothetical protein [Actinomadura rupiterrae]
MSAPPSVRLPADIEREDHLIGSWSARQVAILASTGTLCWLMYLLVGQLLPWPVTVAALIVVAAGGAVLALGQWEGLSADRYLLAAWRFARSPHRQVLAPEGLVDTSAWFPDAGRVAAVRLPVTAMGADGVLELSSGAVAVVAEASTVGFAFRTPAEQRALVAAFARWLNSLTAPVQIVVRAQWVDLAPLAAALEDNAPALAHPALEQAARQHARFLLELEAGSVLLRRQVLLVFTEPAAGRGQAAERAVQRVEAAARTLAAAEITVRRLDGGELAPLLATAVDPLDPLPATSGWAAPDQVTQGAR